MLSCVLFCDSTDYSQPGFSVHGIFQARVLEWVAISSFRETSWDWTCISCFCIGRQILYFFATWEAQIIYMEVLTQCLTYYRHFTTVSCHCHPHNQISKEAEKWTNGGAWIMETVSAKQAGVRSVMMEVRMVTPGSEWADSRDGRPGNRSLSFAVCRDGDRLQGWANRDCRCARGAIWGMRSRLAWGLWDQREQCFATKLVFLAYSDVHLSPWFSKWGTRELWGSCGHPSFGSYLKSLVSGHWSCCSIVIPPRQHLFFKRLRCLGKKTCT